jgi:16S rRNA processing protein RimM
MLSLMAREFAWTWWTPITKPEKLRVGRLLKAHGLKGAIKLELYTDSPETRFKKGAVLELQVPEASPWHGKTVTVSELRWYNTMPVLFLDGITDRTQAESLVRAILLVEIDQNETTDEPDAWYDHQLIGLAVYRDGSEIGKVLRVEHLPAQDLLVINHQDSEVMLPFVSQFVPLVDVKSGRLEITPPGGLFEELGGNDED